MYCKQEVSEFGVPLTRRLLQAAKCSVEAQDLTIRLGIAIWGMCLTMHCSAIQI